MNIPTIDSTPGSSGGRPDTVTPKRTSPAPLYRLRSKDQAPWIRVLSVSCAIAPRPGARPSPRPADARAAPS